MVLRFKHSVIAERAGVGAQTVLDAFEEEYIAVPAEPPVVQPGDVKTQIPAVLIVDTRTFRETVSPGIVEERTVIAVQRYEGHSVGRVETAAG